MKTHSRASQRRRSLLQRILVVTIFVLVVMAAISIASNLGAVPGIWATIMAVLIAVISAALTILPFIFSLPSLEVDGTESRLYLPPHVKMPPTPKPFWKRFFWKPNNIPWKAWIPGVLVSSVLVGFIVWYTVYLSPLRYNFGPHFVGVYSNELQTGFSIDVNTSEKQRQWVTSESDALLLTYPDYQSWGAMALVVGNTPAQPGHRASRDVSLYRSLFADMRSTMNGQCVRIGIKDRTQPDDGSEIRVPECLTTQWLTYALPLDLFANVDLTHLYVMFEVVFQGSAGATVEVHNVRYSLDSVPAPVPPPLPRHFKVYSDWGAPGNHYVPSGSIGDYTDITMTENWTKNPHSGITCIRITYSSAASLGNGWAGVYWQDPVKNWGNTPGPTGYDLSPFSQLSFWVRGDVGGEQIEFRVGGISTDSDGNPLPYGDSLKTPVSTGVIALTTSWQLKTINLRGQDLCHIIGGFAWVSNSTKNPQGATFYLDDIEFT